VGVEDVFLPAASTPAIEAFSVGLSPEDLAVNFVMCFKGLARASSRAEVWIQEWDDLLPRPHFPEVFLGAGAIPVAADLCFCMMGSGQGWQSTPTNSKMWLSHPCRSP
jgi:hypothetical protein